METFARIIILCLAFLVLSMVICAHRTVHDHGHHRTSQRKQKTSYDVMYSGAAGDGKTDDSKAFISAWKAACGDKWLNNTKLTVPGGKTFLVSAIVFEGPCISPSITFEILGSIIAPQRSAWKRKWTDEWLHFHGVDGLTVEGNGQGLIDGQGNSWWKYGDASSRPTALRFSSCKKLHVRGLKHINSQRNHVLISNCTDATISNLHMTAPRKSPNTDGIDIAHSTTITIQDSIMETGDDCIAINGGTSYVIISNITCGPGHGISIGSLGAQGRRDEVEAIHINNCTFKGTDNGVRIKTWQGGSGFARNITFSNITYIEADNPVLIDQYYCPHTKCANQTSAVQISDVRYIGLHGTSISTNSTINLSCSETVPCTSIILDEINIIPANRSNSILARCVNAHGKSHHCLNPTVKCLTN